MTVMIRATYSRAHKRGETGEWMSGEYREIPDSVFEAFAAEAMAIASGERADEVREAYALLRAARE